MTRTSHRRLATLALFLPFLLTLSALVGAQESKSRVYVEINAPSRQPFPLALPEFKNLSAKPDDQKYCLMLAELVEANLRLTGLFTLLDRKAFLENPQSVGLESDAFDMANWRQIDALGLAKGGFETRGTQLTTQLRVYDVLAGAQIGGKAYVGSTKDVRRVAAQMANDIVYFFTGERGFFMSKIAAVDNSTGKKEVVVMDVDGKNQVQLTKYASITLLPSWSPFGNQIAYTSYKAGNPDLYVADLVKGVTRRVSYHSGINTGGTFSPSGDELALTLAKDGDPEIYVIDASSGREKARLTRSYGVDSSPTWSPDGRRLAFVSSRAGGAHVYVMNRDGSGVRRLTFSGSQNVSPSWSPRGDRIAFAGRDAGAFDIFVVEVESGRISRVTQDAGDNEDPAWSPDGNYLVFSSTRDRKSRSQLYIASVDGRTQTRITNGPGAYSNPRWSPFVEW